LPTIDLNSTPTALALAWLAKNPNTSTIILGVSSAEQLLENLEALKVLPKITDEHLAQIEEILGNKPEPFVRALHPSGPGGLLTLRLANVLKASSGYIWETVKCPRHICT
jgi:hypothetical protein